MAERHQTHSFFRKRGSSRWWPDKRDMAEVVDAYSDLFEKTKTIPDLLIEDVKKLYASEKGTSESQ